MDPENREQADPTPGPDDAQTRDQQRHQFKQEIRQAGGKTSPDIDFNTFLISLGSSAIYHMGAPLPDGEKGETNLELAQQTIDILGMLEHKTQGNLTAEESELLSTLLYDLRLRYVQALRESGK